MNSFLDDLTLEQLDGDSRELAEVIGMDAFKKLVEVYGGSGSLYIPSFATLRAGLRNQKIGSGLSSGLKSKAFNPQVSCIGKPCVQNHSGLQSAGGSAGWINFLMNLQ